MFDVGRVVMGAALALVASAAHAQSPSASGYGSAVYTTVRNCTPGAAVCDGSGQPVLERGYAGGYGQAADTRFASNAATSPVASSGKVVFGTSGIPQIKTSVSAGTTARAGNTVFTFQTFTYTGAEDIDLLLNATFHIVDSSTDGGNGAYANGATAGAGFAIWDAADFFSYMPADLSTLTAQGIVQRSGLFGTSDCSAFDPSQGDIGPRAASSFGTALGGGANQSLGIAQQNCWEDTLTLSNGDSFVIASYTQLTANRGGWVDATGTFTVDLDPTMGADAIAAFRSNVTFVTPAVTAPVPEPASWALMLLGFAATGIVMRQRHRRDLREAIS